jgi:hypothetical protein
MKMLAKLFSCFVILASLAGCTMVVDPNLQPQATEVVGRAEMSVDDKIANALTAAPTAVAERATVLDWPGEAGAKMPILLTGSNGWSCLPDDPATPTNDPYCLDDNWLDFFAALMEGRDPDYTDFGIGYMLQGGSGASSTDPFATEPPAGEEWMVDGPHFMVVTPMDLDPADFPTDPLLGQPSIRYEGTLYEHLMIPVETRDAQPADDKIANAMSAGPAAVAEGATIIDWPSEAGGQVTKLRAGSNGWTCIPDDPATPTMNDPQCGDAMWLRWLEAFMAGKEPKITAPGIAYLLQGGAAASNADPMVMEPAAGEAWMEDGPLVMLFSPEPLDQEVFSTEHRMDGTYIMWAGTPYEHIMVPVELPESE